MLGETILTVLSAGAGSILRMVPEVIKVFDAKNERAHEALMFDKQIELAKLQDVREAKVLQNNVDLKGIDALIESIKGQTQLATKAGGWVLTLSAAVRPTVTFWQYTLYSVVKLAELIVACSYVEDKNLITLLEVIKNSWTVADASLLSMITMFWFTGRIYDKRQGP